MRKLMGNSEFKRALTAFYGHAKVTGPMLQELIEDGLQQAMHPKQGGHGSLNRLSMVIHACQQVKTIPTRTVQRYIQQHADVKWCKLDGEQYGFKYNGSPDASLPEVTWYDWEGNQEKNAKPAVDLEKRIKALLSEAKNAEKKGRTVEHEEYVPELEKLLSRMTAEVHTEEV